MIYAVILAYVAILALAALLYQCFTWLLKENARLVEQNADLLMAATGGRVGIPIKARPQAAAPLAAPSVQPRQAGYRVRWPDMKRRFETKARKAADERSAAADGRAQSAAENTAADMRARAERLKDLHDAAAAATFEPKVQPINGRVANG